MDDVATRVISSALTMYDIMERRVTLVERLSMNRQPFPDMDVIYVAVPTVEAARKISSDFEAKKSRYGHVHLFFLDSVILSHIPFYFYLLKLLLFHILGW